MKKLLLALKRLIATELKTPEAGFILHELVGGLQEVKFEVGTVIKFDRPKVYGYPVAETGNITIDTTELVPGLEQLLIHNTAEAPTFPESCVLLGEYIVDVDNYIKLRALSASRIMVTFFQVPVEEEIIEEEGTEE